MFCFSFGPLTNFQVLHFVKIYIVTKQSSTITCQIIWENILSPCIVFNKIFLIFQYRAKLDQSLETCQILKGDYVITGDFVSKVHTHKWSTLWHHLVSEFETNLQYIEYKIWKKKSFFLFVDVSKNQKTTKFQTF